MQRRVRLDLQAILTPLEKFQYTEQHDKLMLQAALEAQPWAAKHRDITNTWNTIASEVNASLTGTGVHRRFDLLYKKWKQDDRTNRGRSGHSEDYSEIDELWQQVHDATLEAELGVAAKTASEAAKQVAKNAATSRLKDDGLQTVVKRRASAATATEDGSSVTDQAETRSILGGDGPAVAQKRRRTTNASSEFLDFLETDATNTSQAQAVEAEVQRERMVLDRERLAFEQRVWEEQCKDKEAERRERLLRFDAEQLERKSMWELLAKALANK